MQDNILAEEEENIAHTTHEERVRENDDHENAIGIRDADEDQMTANDEVVHISPKRSTRKRTLPKRLEIMNFSLSSK